MKTYKAYYESPAGWLVVECTDTAITHILFTNEPGKRNNKHPLLTQALHQLDGYFKGTVKRFHLPLSPAGTEFQQKVWDALKEIPFGKSTSYMALSKNLGDVKAIRAVGTANGKNPIAIVIPCHRVIGSDGSLTGYAGGLDRKKWLLQHEGVLPKELSLF